MSVFLSGKFSRNIPRLLFGYSFDFCQSFRLFLHDAQAVFFKFLDNPLGYCFSYSLYCPGRQVFLHAESRVRRKEPRLLHNKLPAINGMLLPPAFRLNSFRDDNMGEASYKSPFLSLVFYRKNSISALFAPKNDMTDFSF